MPVLEKMPTETLRRSVAASIKSTSKKSNVSKSFKEAAKEAAKNTAETTTQKTVANGLKEECKKAVATASTEPTSAEPTKAEAIQEAQVCWISTKLAPYHPDHQVELLHLQAEVDALLIKMQAQEQRRTSEKTAL